MDPSLVQLITEMVMAELNRGAASEPAPRPLAAAEAVGSSRRRKLLLVPAPAGDSHDPVWAALAGIPEVSWTAVRVPGVGLQESAFAAQWIDAPVAWDELVHGHAAVVLPVFKLETLSRLAALLPDTPACAAAVAGIMQGVSVFASAFEVDRIKRASNRLPGPFLSIFHQHLRTVEGMGVQVLEGPALAQRLGAARESAVRAGSPRAGRDVLTVADLEAAARAGQKTLQVAPGTIITPLARDVAAQMQIEVRFS